ncbi:GDP-fucose synthetase [Geothermobacter hydrogeniphilus]|uniref:GDP-L-fucose synthase n=1 Tax=Geothermobacter hydrogeniphilus TaxID=1969733 RepID=A0A2K2H618_9BACT|nr:GDP-L-fucose synthase [Geothermobacter hydrogeniphilus]PNU18687.1 GDP-fucose synthetase [Geothermobacter hydrogeniphilus]
MKTDSKIFVAGANGLVGSAIVRRLQAGGCTNLLTPERDELDLTDQRAVADFFRRQRPEHVILAAAKVGGIHANNTYPAEFIQQNLAIQTNVIHAAYENRVERLLFLGSSCIYPKLAPQPMRESHLLTGPLEPTNEPYAIAKIAGLKMCEAYNRQYGTKFVAVMPTNLYGPGDNFHPENSHVLPALIRRFHEAKLAMEGKHPSPDRVTVWGSGKPMREFLYVDDMADGSLFVLGLDEQTLQENLLSYPKPCFVNLGTGVDVSIRELAETIKDVVGYPGALEFDPSKPDGTMRKLQDVSRMTALGWQAKVSLREGIERTYRWFLEHEEEVRG